MSTDKPQVLDAQEAETIETGKPVEYYQAWVDGLKADGAVIDAEKIVLPLLKAISESSLITDFDRRRLSDEIIIASAEVTEPTKSKIASLKAELQKNDTDIPKDARIDQIAEFMNTEYMEGMLKQFGSIDVSHLLPDKADPTALQMYLARGNMSFFEMSNVQKKMSKDFVKELDKIDFTSVLGANSTNEVGGESTSQGSSEETFQEYVENTKGVLNAAFGEGTSDKMLDTFSEIKATMTQLKKNLEFLKSKDDVASTDIDFSRTTVIAYIGDIGTQLTQDNSAPHITELQKLSNDSDYDRDTALEEQVTEMNKIFEGEGVDSEKVQTLLEGIENTGKDLSKMITQLSNESPIGALIAKLFQEGGPLAFLAALFGPEFQEAISESNLRKQKALFNLVKISSEDGEGFKMDGVDFSNIKSSQLKKFFTAMDSRGIKYEHENFWENLMTGEVDGDGADVEGVATIRKELQGEDENVFTKENDFSNNNTGFKDRLNAIEKKKDEVVDGNGDAVVVGDSTLKTDTPK